MVDPSDELVTSHPELLVSLEREVEGGLVAEAAAVQVVYHSAQLGLLAHQPGVGPDVPGVVVLKLKLGHGQLPAR